MLTWLAPLLVFGLVVFVHELGHFLAAKAVGVYAPRFSIGFGPALLRKRWGETEYVIAALPLGGYVRMASREDETMALLEGGGEAPRHEPGTVGANDSPKLASEHIAEGLRPEDYDENAMWPFGPKPVPEHRWFESKPLPARLLILIAGVTMNAVLTFTVATGMIAHYGTGYRPAVIDSVVAEHPAARAGLQRGDSIVAVGTSPVTRWSEVVELVGGAPGRDITLDVQRAGAPVTVRLRPEPTVEQDIAGRDVTVGRIGAVGTPTIIRQPVSVVEAATRGWTVTWAMAGTILTVVQGLFNGSVSPSNLGGPIAIAQTSVEAARGGLEQLLQLVAFISINIAIVNLLPIPILDGGQILLNVAESVKGRPFSAVARERIARVGLVAIGLLFVFVMFNDIKRLVITVFG